LDARFSAFFNALAAALPAFLVAADFSDAFFLVPRNALPSSVSFHAL
jgi:hypothetical protein